MTLLRFNFFVISILLCFAVINKVMAWEFTPAIAVTKISGQKIYHHVESSGRRNISVSGETIAVAWEDNRDQVPRIYLAIKSLDDRSFGTEMQLSENSEAFEPSIAALDESRFVVAWEEDSKIHARQIESRKLGPTLVVGAKDSYQASVLAGKGQVFVVYAQQEGQFQEIRIQPISPEGNKLLKGRGCRVDTENVKADQLYPTAVIVEDKIVVAWEDRRPGHTIIMASQSRYDSPCQFTKPHRISDAKQVVRNVAFGKGHGVSRVALAQFGKDKMLAAWADKRDFREGYDIYAAHYDKNKTRLFGDNAKVQDSFGGHAQQWHAAVAGHDSGQVVVAWDDKRDGDANIMFSWLEDGQWSEDSEVSVASGKGEQAHPSIAFDKDGNLHIVWVERASVNGPTRLLYTKGKPTDN